MPAEIISFDQRNPDLAGDGYSVLKNRPRGEIACQFFRNGVYLGAALVRDGICLYDRQWTNPVEIDNLDEALKQLRERHA